MDTNIEDEQIKEVIRLFCLIIRKDPKAVDEVATALTKSPTLLTKRLEFFCGSIYYHADTQCACQIDHELFTYVSHDGIDAELFDHILASLETGTCCHHHRLPEEDEEMVGPSPASVQLIHAAAVVGCVPVLEILLTLPQKAQTFGETIRSLNASPLHLAILFKQRQCIKTIIESGHEKLETYCNNQFIYAVRSQTNLNLINKTSMSIIKLCMVMNDNQTAQNIVQHTSLRAAWVIDAMTSESECLKALILSNVNEQFIAQITILQVVRILKLVIKNGDTLHIAEMLINRLKSKPRKCTTLPWALLATIYNQPRILEIFLDSNLTTGAHTVRDYTIVDIANSVDHRECADILKNHGIKGSNIKNSSPFLVIFDTISLLQEPEQTDVLLRKVWLKKPVAENKEECRALVVDPFTYKCGIGLRALIEICGDVEVKGPDGFTPLALALKHSSSPRAILDVLYCNPILTDFEKENMVRTHREKHLQLFDREKVTQMTSLALAIERDLKNYFIQKWALDGSGFSIYEGSMATLLLECGYDIRGDKIVRSSYSQLLQGGYMSAREREIRQKILDKIESELYRPKSLKEYCRNSLRGAFPGLKLHMLMNTNLVPTTIKNFILLESRLKQRYDERSSIVCIEEML